LIMTLALILIDALQLASFQTGNFQKHKKVCRVEFTPIISNTLKHSNTVDAS
jgi:hypothetical protein